MHYFCNTPMVCIMLMYASSRSHDHGQSGGPNIAPHTKITYGHMFNKHCWSSGVEWDLELGWVSQAFDQIREPLFDIIKYDKYKVQ